MAKKQKAQGIDLGELQQTFQSTQRAWQAAERALARAQETRDGAKMAALAADGQLKEAVRSVVG